MESSMEKSKMEIKGVGGRLMETGWTKRWRHWRPETKDWRRADARTRKGPNLETLEMDVSKK